MLRRPTLVTRLTQFEHVSQHVATSHVFLRRCLTSLGVVVVLLSASLLVGAAGYTLLEKDPIAGLYDAAMIMSGMGPVNHPAGPWGKFLASLYALYSGLLLAVVTGSFWHPSCTVSFTICISKVSLGRSPRKNRVLCRADARPGLTSAMGH
jgi:hypothetical protein